MKELGLLVEQILTLITLLQWLQLPQGALDDKSVSSVTTAASTVTWEEPKMTFCESSIFLN